MSDSDSGGTVFHQFCNFFCAFLVLSVLSLCMYYKTIQNKMVTWYSDVLEQNKTQETH